MFVIVCAGCDAPLTDALAEVVLPAHARQAYGNGVQLPVLMEPGTFAVDPEPWGRPWRPWEELGPGEAAARGFHAPVPYVSDGVRGAIVIAPGDARGTRLIPERAGGYCCGLDWGDGPNMACVDCGLPVASRIDDCSLWQAVWFAPDAVRRHPVDGADTAPRPWAALTALGSGTPPVEAIGRWSMGTVEQPQWRWSPRWEAAVGRALAHLLVSGRGRPVQVPEGLAAEVFQRTLDALVPPGPPAVRAVLAGPGAPAPDADADVLLVPAHPETGEAWRPEGPAGAAARVVPLPFGVWRWLVAPERDARLPQSGGMPREVLRDEPALPRAHCRFRPDLHVFQHTLARLPAARAPWLRAILDDPWRYRREGAF